MINFKNVSKAYGDKTVLKNINLHINNGEFFVFVGTSGSGKTTTLKMINRLVEPTEGIIEIEGVDSQQLKLRDMRLEIGYVLQSGALFPNMTVYENIALIPEMKKWKKKDMDKRIDELLTLVELEPDKYKNSYPYQLSGGEQQRIGILRAIVANPKILLMDESFSALDPIIRSQLQGLIKQIHNKFKITTVFVTHDMGEAASLGDRIAIMSDGEILQIDTPENIMENPANEFIDEFFHQGGMINE